MSTLLEDKRQSLVNPQQSNPFKDRKNPYDVQSIEELTSNPHARNPVFTFKTQKLRLKCPYEQDCSSLKRFKNALSLYWHFAYDHRNKSDTRIRIQKVADTIIASYGDEIIKGINDASR